MFYTTLQLVTYDTSTSQVWSQETKGCWKKVHQALNPHRDLQNTDPNFLHDTLAHDDALVYHQHAKQEY